jgi:chemotaxis protein histidine kinase CheA
MDLFLTSLTEFFAEVAEAIVSYSTTEKAEAEKVAAKKAEAEKVAAEKAEAEKVAAKKAEAEKVAAEKAEAEKVAAEKAEAEKVAAEKAEAEKVAAEKAEAEKVAAEKAEAEKVAAEKAEAEKVAAEKAEAEKVATEKAEAENEAVVREAKIRDWAEWFYETNPVWPIKADQREKREKVKDMKNILPAHMVFVLLFENEYGCSGCDGYSTVLIFRARPNFQLPCHHRILELVFDMNITGLEHSGVRVPIMRVIYLPRTEQPIILHKLVSESSCCSGWKTILPVFRGRFLQFKYNVIDGMRCSSDGFYEYSCEEYESLLPYQLYTEAQKVSQATHQTNGRGQGSGRDRDQYMNSDDDYSIDVDLDEEERKRVMYENLPIDPTPELVIYREMRPWN